MNNPLLRRVMLAVAAPLLAGLFAVVVSAIVLEVSGSPALDTFRTIGENGLKLETMIDTLNRATPLFLAAVAAAIGFRMNLFNIGVEGQYILAAFLAAVVGSKVDLPGVLHVAVIIATAMLVGALWSGLAGLLLVSRGVNEVISTIMLNFIATGGIVAGLLPRFIDDPTAANQGTPTLAESGWLPDLNGVVEIFTREIGKGRELTGVLVIALMVGVIYHVIINRSLLGFDIRASGMNPLAARVGGVPPKRMIMVAMIGGGLVAGLVGMPEILSDTHAYDQGFIQGLGFAGIGVALLGRNTSAGMAAAALLFGFLDSSSAVLQVRASASSEIVVIMQATFLLAAVVAYEVVNRVKQRDEVARAVRATTEMASNEAAVSA
ncbi:MAG: ABC transporter permease [Acidimicrobiia bacterium]|nr:ABC transporter permease [Acidimicrobiia bacterium]